MAMRSYLWILLAVADAALLVALGFWLDLPIFYALAPLSFPAWAWVDSRPEARAWLDRHFGD